MALGDGVKAPTSSEWKNRDIVRKSLVAMQPIKIGECFTEKNITCKRPGNGRSPYRFWETLGEVAAKNFETDELIND
jgi:N-acetylneuraminate synthase